MELIKKLKQLRIRVGGFDCQGCGYEHDCSINGCAILCEAIAVLERLTADEAQGNLFLEGRQ